MKLGEDYLDAGNRAKQTFFFSMEAYDFLGEYFELHHGDPLASYSLHLKADKTLQKHG